MSAIVILKLVPDIWLSPLMILGTQWYILFNVIVGASAVAPDRRYAGANLGVRGWLWWNRVALSAVFRFRTSLGTVFQHGFVDSLRSVGLKY